MKKLISVIIALTLLLAAVPALADLPNPAGAGIFPDPTEPQDLCPVCGFCPHPLGLCIFLWIAIGLAIAAVIVLIVRTVRKKKAGNERPRKRNARSRNKR